MTEVVVDANVLIAARLSRDQNHDRALELIRGFDQGDLPAAFVPSNVVEEVVNYLLRKSAQEVAEETLDAIIESSGFEVDYTPRSDFNAGRSLFRTYDRLSLTDAIIVASMHRRNVEYLYSLDDGFDGVDGITRLTTPSNPFE